MGSPIHWWKPFDVLNELDELFVPSAESISLDHQEVDLALKSSNMTETDDLTGIEEST